MQFDSSIIKILTVFYLLSINSPNHLVSKRLKNYIETNNYIQHVLSFVTIFVLITLFYPCDCDIVPLLINTTVCYLLFVLSTKLDVQWNLIILIGLIIGYYYDLTNSKKKQQIEMDPVLNPDEKTRITTYIMENKTNITLGLGLAILIGVLFYSQKKQKQYGSDYDIAKFIFG